MNRINVTLLLLLCCNNSYGMNKVTKKNLVNKIIVSNCLTQDNKNGIHSYKPEHEPFIKKIALQDIPRLVTTLSHNNKEYECLYNESVLTALESNDTVSKVYLVDERPVGLINYTLFDPWYKYLMPNEFGPNATIDHFVVDKEQRGKGYGIALMHDALNDCEKLSVNNVSFWTTSYDLENYYYKIGFRKNRTTKLGEQSWIKRLRPHPATIILERIRRI